MFLEHLLWKPIRTAISDNSLKKTLEANSSCDGSLVTGAGGVEKAVDGTAVTGVGDPGVLPLVVGAGIASAAVGAGATGAVGILGAGVFHTDGMAEKIGSTLAIPAVPTGGGRS